MRSGKEKQREGLREEIEAIEHLDVLFEAHDLKHLAPALKNLTFAGKCTTIGKQRHVYIMQKCKGKSKYTDSPYI